ncbi:PREDICTED: outer envelope pore protein 16-3, chloroplastic/mitochondrial-like [Tarenaya hassleriana]|uniref:outer envelope pore protein 16-3, chloroplastic/mitochondrial-like n=1 Tax=Tarenaya hassleriana TaxID=28532 RepID=UPI00053C8461|nr:PREDICTED: outer envelope pore protein 16-3, chloroplastic/mitochondrial-like [Tarenaya hassleriana]XP_010554859.1 PREDICTED: outer envelope pore protein 16-3, chloroplastic/mitochondrial-like [Tarenaya hassleriana]
MAKTFEGAIGGLVVGALCGTARAAWAWKGVPRAQRNVTLPVLIGTLKVIRNHGLVGAAVGGIYSGSEQLAQRFRMKRDFVNGAVGGFVAGASVVGFGARSIPAAIKAGATCAALSTLGDLGAEAVEKRAGADS